MYIGTRGLKCAEVISQLLADMYIGRSSCFLTVIIIGVGQGPFWISC